MKRFHRRARSGSDVRMKHSKGLEGLETIGDWRTWIVWDKCPALKAVEVECQYHLLPDALLQRRSAHQDLHNRPGQCRHLTDLMDKLGDLDYESRPLQFMWRTRYLKHCWRSAQACRSSRQSTREVHATNATTSSQMASATGTAVRRSCIQDVAELQVALQPYLRSLHLSTTLATRRCA